MRMESGVPSWKKLGFLLGFDGGLTRPIGGARLFLASRAATFLPHPRVGAVPGEKLTVGSGLDDFTILQHDHPIGIPRHVEPVRDEDSSASEAVQVVIDPPLGQAIEGG